MDMTMTQQVLVVILSSFLGLFLLLSIIALVLILQILRYVKRVTAKADRLAEKAESIAEIIETASPAVAIGKVIATACSSFSKARKDKESK